MGREEASLPYPRTRAHVFAYVVLSRPEHCECITHVERVEASSIQHEIASLVVCAYYVGSVHARE